MSMDSSTGISLRFVQAALAAVMLSPLITVFMWLGTGLQLNSIQDNLDALSSRQQQIPVSCTQVTEGVWIWKRTTKSCTGGTE